MGETTRGENQQNPNAISPRCVPQTYNATKSFLVFYILHEMNKTNQKGQKGLFAVPCYFPFLFLSFLFGKTLRVIGKFLFCCWKIVRLICFEEITIDSVIIGKQGKSVMNHFL